MTDSWWQTAYEAAFPPAEPPQGIAAQLAAATEPAEPVTEPIEPEHPALAVVVELHPRIQTQCTAKAKQTGERCRRPPRPGATTCYIHGSGTAAAKAKADERVAAAKALELARKTAGDLDLTQFADPFQALEFAVAAQFRMAERLTRMAEALPDDQVRYMGKLAEQSRAEMTLAQTALRDLRASATDSLKLGLAEKRIKIEQEKADIARRALDAALASIGADEPTLRRARKVLYRELRIIDREGGAG